MALVSSAGAAQLWPGVDPIGQVLRIERPDPLVEPDLQRYPEVVVIGVVRDVVSGLVFEGMDAAHLYLPTHPASPRAAVIVARSRSTADARTESMQNVLATVHPDPLAFETLPLDDRLALQTFPLRVAALIGWGLSAIALVLSVSGLYGVIVYTLSQRRKEIGIRIALGAHSSSVIGLVMRQSGSLAGIAGAIGLVTAIGVMIALRALVPMKAVTFVDVWVFAGSVAVIATATGFATYFPARRASRIEPAQILRSDS